MVDKTIGIKSESSGLGIVTTLTEQKIKTDYGVRVNTFLANVGIESKSGAQLSLSCSTNNAGNFGLGLSLNKALWVTDTKNFGNYPFTLRIK